MATRERRTHLTSPTGWCMYCFKCRWSQRTDFLLAHSTREPLESNSRHVGNASHQNSQVQFQSFHIDSLNFRQTKQIISCFLLSKGPWSQYFTDTYQLVSLILLLLRKRVKAKLQFIHWFQSCYAWNNQSALIRWWQDSEFYNGGRYDFGQDLINTAWCTTNSQVRAP